MWDQAQGPIWEKIEQHFHTQDLRQASQEDHQRIFSALVAGAGVLLGALLAWRALRRPVPSLCAEGVVP
ncbi:hypothetical protein G6F54_014259 [Rhizopus delemar]|nr:hypothetical protein G6F54_014259 [Rhizopus delemar]